MNEDISKLIQMSLFTIESKPLKFVRRNGYYNCSPGKVCLNQINIVEQAVNLWCNGKRAAENLELLTTEVLASYLPLFQVVQTPLKPSLVLLHLRRSTEIGSTRITNRSCCVQNKRVRHSSRRWLTSILNLVTFYWILFNLLRLCAAT